MSETIIDTSKAPCPRCNNKAIIKETTDPDSKTLMCLECGFYRTENVSFYMQLRDVNIMRETFGLAPLSELKKTNSNF